MVRVLLRGMVARGFRTPVLAEELGHATIPLSLKRALVKSAIEQGGLACLPLLGRGLHGLAMEPTHLALTAGRSAGTMLVRWQRLERYIHSQHRIRIHELGDAFALIEHVHKDHDAAKPLAFEDLVVCGVLCALLEANGLTSVKAESDGIEIFPSPDQDSLAQLVHRGQTGQWLMTWQSAEKNHSPLDQSVSWAHVSPKMWSPFACTVGDLIARRLPEILQLDAAASEIGISRRSFQRILATEKLNYQRLQAEVRFRLAGWHLIHQEMRIAEIGFICGYSDQAHLTREFNRRMGIPPAKYRDLFASP